MINVKGFIYNQKNTEQKQPNELLRDVGTKYSTKINYQMFAITHTNSIKGKLSLNSIESKLCVQATKFYKQPPSNCENAIPLNRYKTKGLLMMTSHRPLYELLCRAFIVGQRLSIGGFKAFLCCFTLCPLFLEVWCWPIVAHCRNCRRNFYGKLQSVLYSRVYRGNKGTFNELVEFM